MEKMNKYAVLSADLAKAYKKAFALYGGSEDGGTCNFDGPAIKLPRWIEEKTRQAAKAAGLDCWKWELWGHSRFVIALPGECGQANRRSRVSETMVTMLKAKGYDVTEYCCAD